MKSALTILVLAAGSACAQVPQLGRLFTTPAERQQLDQARLRGITATTQAATPPAPPPPAPAPPQPLVVSGFVKRSNGPSTAWINGEVRGTTAGGYIARAPDGRSIVVKPGQEYDPATGSVRDVPGR